MDVKELRVGNLVGVELKNIHEIVVTEIRKDCIFSGKINVSYDMIHPILLTEERLIEFGFELDSKNNEYPFKFIKNKGMRNEVEIENLNSTTCFVLSHGRRFSLVKIEHVHQLQNLYYSLTGNELK